MTRFTSEEVERHVHAAAESMLDNLAHDYWRLPTRNVPSAARAVWDKETLPAIVRYCQEIYRANMPPLKRIVAVLDIEDEEGVDLRLVTLPGVTNVLLTRDASDDVMRFLEQEPQVGETAQAERETAWMEERERREAHTVESRLGQESVAPTLEERLTDETFFGRESGSVLNDEYNDRLAEVRDAVNYLRNERVFRVEYNRSWIQTPKVNWVEAVDAAEASIVPEHVSRLAAAVRVVSVRRATEEDGPEYVRQIAEEEGWK